jgi:hypothetical protein
MSHEKVQESLGTRTLKDGSVHRMRGQALHYHCAMSRNNILWHMFIKTHTIGPGFPGCVLVYACLCFFLHRYRVYTMLVLDVTV